MSLPELHKTYPNRNIELRVVAKKAYEFGKTIAKEPSAALSSGLDDHAIARQRQYLEHLTGMVEALHAKPIPDLPATHPLKAPIVMTDEYITFTTDVGGAQIPINESTQLLAEMWLVIASELALSQSAAIGGSLVEYDYQRAINNIGALTKLLDEMTQRPIMDLPETAEPGSEYGVTSSS